MYIYLTSCPVQTGCCEKNGDKETPDDSKIIKYIRLNLKDTILNNNIKGFDQSIILDAYFTGKLLGFTLKDKSCDIQNIITP